MKGKSADILTKTTSVPAKDLRAMKAICEKVATGTSRDDGFGDFASGMAHRAFRTTAAQMVRNYRDKHERGEKVPAPRQQMRCVPGCFKASSTGTGAGAGFGVAPLTYQQMAQKLQAAIDRVMQGGWANESRISIPPAVPETGSLVMGPEIIRTPGAGEGQVRTGSGVLLEAMGGGPERAHMQTPSPRRNR